MSGLLVGLVTHPASRFNANGEATRQAEALVAAMRSRGVDTSFLVSDRNDYDPAQYPLTNDELLRSAWYQTDLEHRWRRYLADAGGRPAKSAFADSLAARAMLVKRRRATGAGWPWSTGAPGREAARRLLNIDLSHLRVLDAGLAERAAWLLVLEDDARVASVNQTADDLVAAIAWLAHTPVAFVCLSESLPLDRLGVRGLVGGHIGRTAPFWLTATATPVTNTVCANLYRGKFASDLARGIRRAGLLPVAPIDWRLNEHVMTSLKSGTLSKDSCAWALPGLFLQGSMHPD